VKVILPPAFTRKASLVINSSEKQWNGPDPAPSPQKPVNKVVLINKEAIHIYSK
jgi:hypothetical protein